MKNDCKILFLDLDGTLLNDKKEITPKNMTAIREALQQKHKIVLASGRATVSVTALAQKLGLTAEGCYAITYNGACIYDFYHQKSIYRNPLPKAFVRRLLDEADACGIYAHTYLKNQILSEHNTKELLSYSASTSMEYLVVDDICQALTEEPEKVIVIDYDTPERLAEFQTSVTSWTQGLAESFFSCPYYLEFVAPGVSKGSAIRILCDYLDIGLENTVSAGDAENDISMLETTHIGAVMKNADPQMYHHGNYVTEHDNNHDAIAEIIYKFIL